MRSKEFKRTLDELLGKAKSGNWTAEDLTSSAMIAGFTGLFDTLEDIQNSMATIARCFERLTVHLERQRRRDETPKA